MLLSNRKHYLTLPWSFFLNKITSSLVSSAQGCDPSLGRSLRWASGVWFTSSLGLGSLIKVLSRPVRTWSGSEFWEDFRMPNGKVVHLHVSWLSQENERFPSHTNPKVREPHPKWLQWWAGVERSRDVKTSWRRRLARLGAQQRIMYVIMIHVCTFWF